MAKSNSLYVEEYRKVRKNLLQNIRRMKQRGYDVSSIKIPDIPKKITEKAIKKLEDLNKKRYEKSKYTYLKYDKKQEEYKFVTVSGKRGIKVEKVKAERKAKQTREIKKGDRLLDRIAKDKGYKSYDEYSKSYEYRQQLREIEREKSEIAYDIEHGGSEEDIYKQQRVIEEGYVTESKDISLKEDTYYLDTESGEYIHKDDLQDSAKKPPRYILMSPEESDKAVVDKAIHDLDILALYDKKGGGKKHNQNTRDNAEGIRDFIKEQYAKDPQKTA